MPYWYQPPDDGVPGQRRFVIVRTAEPNRVLAAFDAMGWAQAVLEYANRLRAGEFSEPASLREARESDDAVNSGEAVNVHATAE